uniref:EOG090X01SN n=1 Tax=Evadne anonyx TaxID=141404 RepID=A0A9N6WPR2_9CRUS|nr:EOG090X01SN [Evadne anonyx]
MSFLRGSASFVWCTTSVLGKGATGAVFQGVNKHTGEAVAVKTFNQLSHMRPQEVQMREFEVLKKVKHENIVKLLAIEEEQDGKGKVIVMELCTGGSLFNILDDPENSSGLPEEEFIFVVQHLAAGMKHLRDNNLVHRDLKPGNIMKFVALDGTTIYKLTDFGAARELEDDQQFMSLYGTEEYLHPDMYERAVLRKPVGKTFGVTLYHVATGNLPFRPYGGRRNKETMFFITAKKSSGVISGVQTSENGEILWSRELTDTCLLSASEAIRLIEEQTGIGQNSQLILQQEALWKDIDKYPSTTINSPLFLFNRENNNVQYAKETGILKFPPFASAVSVETDASIAKQCCSVGYAVKRRIEELTRTYRLMHSSVNCLTVCLMEQLELLVKQSHHCEEQLTLWNRQFQVWQKLHLALKEIFRLVPQDESLNLNSLDKFLHRAKSQHNDNIKQMSGVIPGVQQLNQKVLRDESLTKEWSSVSRPSTLLNGVAGKAATYVMRLKESWQHLLRDRAARVLTYNDEQFHLLERIKMTETFKSIESLLTNECIPAVLTTADSLADWYKMAQAVVLQSQILGKDLTGIESSWVETHRGQDCCHASYMTKFHELMEATKRRIDQNPSAEDQHSAESNVKANDNARAKYRFDDINKGLKELQVVHSDVWRLVEENTQILSGVEQYVNLKKT